MNPWKLAVGRPVMTVMVTMIVAIVGAVALSRLPIDLMPDITFPTLSISTTYSNASPEIVEELITRPIEEAVGSSPGVEELSSVSGEGQSTVRVSFAWGTDLDAAANDLRDRLDRVMRRLPDEAERPSLRKFDLAAFPILILGGSSGLDPIVTRRIIEDQVKYRMERVPGVASLDIWGGLEREVHIDLDPDKLKALGLPLDQIVARIRSGNVEAPAGRIRSGRSDITLRTMGSYASLNDVRNTVVMVRDGSPVRLSDVGEVVDSWRDVSNIVRVNGKPGIRMAVNKQSGTNTVQVARAALKELARINEDIPQITIVPIIDSSKYIQNSITNVSRSALFGGLLAVIVLLVFLRDLRSTGIVAVAIPVSIVATFALMYFWGFTLNVMTLGGLALGVGMLVDNAIVVIENVFRLREAGRRPAEASIEGSGEVAAAIVASTITTIIVFLPMIFMRGMTGIMFEQMAFVVAFSLICSLVIALTVVPMLAARARHVSPGADADGNAVSSALRRAFARLDSGYAAVLDICLRHRPSVVAVALSLLAVSLALVRHVGVELMPPSDEGDVRIEADMDVGTAVEVVNDRLEMIESIVIESVPEIHNHFRTAGGSGWRGRSSHKGQMRLALVPIEERTRSSEEIAADLRKRLSGIAGMTVRTRAGQSPFTRWTGGGSGGDRLQVDVRGYDLETAEHLASRVQEALMSVPGVTDASVSRETGSPEEAIVVDRDRAADMGLTVSDVASAFQTALTGAIAGYFREGGDEYGLRVRLADALSLSLAEVLELTVTNAAGEPIALRNVVRTERRAGPSQIERKNQERVITVSSEISGRDLGTVVADAREALRGIPVPKDFQIVFTGDYEEQQEAFRELILTLVLSLLLVYMVMAALYESLRDPFVVMFSVPLAVIGVVWMLFLTGTTFNIQSFIGIIMLGGIVVNNAILLVDHTNLLRRQEGFELFDAIREAGRRRLRPILMTTMTTVLGLTPLALGLGEGGETQAPMARAVIGGLLSSTMITLVFIPVMYSLFERGGKIRNSTIVKEPVAQRSEA